MALDSRVESATAQLAEFAVEWKPRDLPERAVREAKRCFVDTFGVALVGSVTPSSTRVANLVRREGGSGAATVIGHGFHSSPSMAALANGTTCHALGYDASATVKTTGHPAVCVVPAALAAAEHVAADGRHLIEALIVGFEIVSCVGRAGGRDSGEFYRRGFHGTSVFGVFGATAAAGRLLGLDATQLRRALGIAASSAKGIRANYGTMTKPFHAGEASRAGLVAAILAQDGFTASENALEGRFGWTTAVSVDAKELSSHASQLGVHLSIEDGINVKLFPSGGSSHPTIRAILRLVSENGLKPKDVVEIEIGISEITLSQTLVVQWPNSAMQGRFCLPFLVAAALVDRKVTIDTFSDEKIRQLEPYRPRIKVRGLPGHPPVTAIIRTLDGSEFACEEPSDTFGGEDNEVFLSASDDEVNEKFRNNVESVRSIEIADSLFEVLGDLENLNSLERLGELLS